LEAEADTENLIYLYSHLGRTLELASRFEEALTIYETMGEVAQRRGDRRMALTSLMARATLRSMPISIHDPKRGRSLGMRALTLARELEDRAVEAEILWILCLANQWAGCWQEAIIYGEDSLALARELNQQKQVAQTLNDLGSICYLYTGRLDRARMALIEASQLWRELGNLPMLADSLASTAVAHIYAGDYDEAIACSDEALEISESIGNLWGRSYSQWAIGWVFWERGAWHQGLKVMETSIHLGERAGFGAAQTYTRSDLAALYSDLGVVEKGLQIAQTALLVGERRNHRVDRAKILGVLAHLHLLAGDLDKAEVRVNEAREDPHRQAWSLLVIASDFAEIELQLAKDDNADALSAADRLLDKLNARGARAYIPHALYLRGLALEHMNKITAARDCLTKAQEAAEAVGSRRALWRILPALARVEEDESRAASARRQARGIVRYIADHINDPALRRTFLDQPEVMSLLERE
jgi:tetratricopeptide (TPR) repeat protein